MYFLYNIEKKYVFFIDDLKFEEKLSNAFFIDVTEIFLCKIIFYFKKIE